MYFNWGNEFKELKTYVRDNPPVPLASLAEVTDGTMVTVQGIITEISDIGPAKKLQTITLVDKSNKKVTVNLWPEFINKLDGHEEKFVIIENLRKKVWAEAITLNTTSRTAINAHALHATSRSEMEAWWQNSGITQLYEDIFPQKEQQ